MVFRVTSTASHMRRIAAMNRTLTGMDRAERQLSSGRRLSVPARTQKPLRGFCASAVSKTTS